MGSGREVMDGNLQMDEGLRRSRSRGPRAKSPGAAPRRAARRLARADRPAPGASAASYFRRAPSYYRGRPSAAGPARRGPTGIGRKYGTDHIHVEQEVEDDPDGHAVASVGSSLVFIPGASWYKQRHEEEQNVHAAHDQKHQYQFIKKIPAHARQAAERHNTKKVQRRDVDDREELGHLPRPRQVVSNLPAFFPCLLVSYRPLAYNPGAGFHRAKVTGASRHNPEAHPQPSDTGRLTAGPARTRNINI